MKHLLLTFSILFTATACASANPTTNAPTPATAPPEAAVQPPTDDVRAEPAVEETAAEPEEEAFRPAPERWWYSTAVEESVPGAAVDAAHTRLAGREPVREVIVAVIDGGIDVQHEDLDGVLWRNEDEIDGNGVDDDGNGYVDDIHGWNFIGGSDGRNVDLDTFEMTRLHAACTGGAAAGSLESPGEEECATIQEAYDAERADVENIVGQLEQLVQIYPIIVQILTNEIGEEPTPENVAAFQTADPQLAQARDGFLQLSAAGIDAEVLADEAESARGRLEFGLDPDFDPRPVVGDDLADKSQRSYGNPDVEGPDPGHGTAVASVIAAERDNGVGIEGVASGVRIMAVRAVPNGDERDKDVANAIRYAVDNGAQVINMSFGKAYSPYKEVVDAAVRYADERGVLLVHAAGNDGADLAEEPNFPNPRFANGGQASLWIEVGASSWQGPDSLAATFTNYGAAQVDIFAPGVAIRAASPDDEYRPSDGTSIAAPVVSGLAALLLAYFPELTTADVRRILLETATPADDQVVALPGDEGGSARFGDLSVTGGIINAAEAVRRALQGGD